jgi:hypothetical protein
MAASMKMTAFWDTVLCNWHFRGSYCLYHQGDCPEASRLQVWFGRFRHFLFAVIPLTVSYKTSRCISFNSNFQLVTLSVLAVTYATLMARNRRGLAAIPLKV